jgi:hypothetical protein
MESETWMKAVVLITVLMFAACTDPALTANLRVGPGGVDVYPAVSGRVGDVGVTVAP